MTLAQATASHFYKYSSPEHLERLNVILAQKQMQVTEGPVESL